MSFQRYGCPVCSAFGSVVSALGILSLAAVVRADPSAGDIKYSRDIRPIFSENCFACHGPDAPARKAELRLDTKDGLFAKADDTHAVVPGEPGKSAILARVQHADADEVMPPPKTGKKLTPRQIDLVTKWIEQGAKWEGHWAYIAPVRPMLPPVKRQGWVRNAVDAFILARLEAEGLAPSPEADKATLVRRLTLDLTGLPPTPAEVDAFLADESPDAYEKVVDRLLADPKYGERMALEWLDAARYADTHGYHIDSGREMWLWREWVIDAFNRNMPFDQFTVEQLAGDMLPGATVPQKIASGFHRNHMINYEGGAIPEEYHTAYLMDRVNTTGAVWMGMTVQCSQCHDHKYDPLTQKDYYQLYAFFNNVPENGLDGKKGNAVPFMKVPNAEQAAALDALAKSIQEVERKLSSPMPELDVAQAQWEAAAAGEHTVEWVALDPTELISAGKATLTKREDKSVSAGGVNPEKDTYTVVAPTSVKGVTALRVEALPDDALVAKGPGRSENGNAVLTDVRVGVSNVAAPAERKAVKFKSASADYSQPNFPVSGAIDDQPQSGWAIFPEVGKPHAAVFELAESISIDGAVLTVALDFQSIYPRHQFGRIRMSVTNALRPQGVGKLPDGISKALAVPADQRTGAQKAEIRAYFRSNVSPEGKKLGEELAKHIKARAELESKVPTTMVMQEMEKPRDTFLLARGQYDARGEKVSPTVPAFLPAAVKGAPANRMGLAQWLVDAQNPLTSRVTVNRHWQTFFGTGIVKTVEDFGSQGEMPSHADLLDWLAVEFRDPSTSSGQAPSTSSGQAPSTSSGQGKGWDVKSFVRLLVTSATYRQSSAVSRELLAKDPENRLLARGPRYRLTAEFVRDGALSVAGLLDPRIGGLSVFPYQPAGLWEELMVRSDGDQFTAQKYTPSRGADLYRRSMYTFWKRTSPPPALSAFDAPDRETCTVRRGRTNTPLQALVLMNDPTYVEAARKLAERMLKEPAPGASADERIAFAFRLATARKPTAEEAGVLRKIYDEQSAHYRSNADAAAKLLTVGESPRDEKLDPIDLAAWTTVASTILNLDETITKG